MYLFGLGFVKREELHLAFMRRKRLKIVNKHAYGYHCLAHYTPYKRKWFTKTTYYDRSVITWKIPSIEEMQKLNEPLLLTN